MGSAVTAGQKHVSSILTKTDQSRTVQYLKRMSIFFMPVATLIVMSAIAIHNAVSITRSSILAKSTLTRDMATADLVQEIQLERGLSTMRQVEMSTELLDRLLIQVTKVDEALKRIPYWVSVFIGNERVDSKNDLSSILNKKRLNARVTNDQPINILTSYTEVTYGLLRRVNSEIHVDETGMIWRIMVAHLAIIQTIEHAGIERALGSVYFRQCHLPQKDYLLLLKSRAKARVLLSVAGNYYAETTTLTENLLSEKLLSHMNTFSNKTTSKDFVEECRSMKKEERNIFMLHWFDNMTQYISAVGQTRRNLSTAILDSIGTIVTKAQNDTIAYTIAAIVLITLSSLAGFWNAKGITGIIETIGYHAHKLHENNAILDSERCKTEELLHSMLPTFVAMKLKRGEEVPPREYESATVYFSDLYGFDEATSKMEPSYAIQLLNDVYTLFDGIIDQHSVYKVETVGDHYMVVSGLPEEMNEKHVVHIGNMALMMADEFSPEWRLEHCQGADIKIRSGFHTGSVVAGVVGKKLPRYCLFGDTVNTASRMQSKSKGGNIQISGASAAILKKYPKKFEVVERGMVEFKGKGKMKTFWLFPGMKKPTAEKTMNGNAH